MLDCILHELGIRRDAELLHDAIFVEAYCSMGDLESEGNFLHGPALSEHLQDLALPIAQVLGATQRFWIADEALFDRVTDLRRDVGHPPDRVMDRLQEFFPLRVFQQITRGPHPECLARYFSIGIHGKENDFYLRHLPF